MSVVVGVDYRLIFDGSEFVSIIEKAEAGEYKGLSSSSSSRLRTELFKQLSRKLYRFSAPSCYQHLNLSEQAQLLHEQAGFKKDFVLAQLQSNPMDTQEHTPLYYSILAMDRWADTKRREMKLLQDIQQQEQWEIVS